MSRLRRYAEYSVVMVGQSTVQRLASLLTNMVLARALGVMGFGVFSVVANTASSAFGILRLGSEWAILVQTAERGTDTAKRSHGELLGAGLLLLLVSGVVGLAGCVVFAEPIAQGIFNDRSIAIWIRAAGVYTMFLCLSQFCSAALAGLERFTSYAKVAASMSILQAASTAPAGVVFGLPGAVIASILVQALTVVAIATILRRALQEVGVQVTFRHPFSSICQLLAFGLPFHAAALVSIPVSYYMQGTLAWYFGVDSLGYLRAVTSVTMLVTFVPGTLATTVAVMLSSATQPGHFAAETMRVLKLTSLFCVLIALLVSLAVPWLIPILFGASYASTIGVAGLALTSSVLLAISSTIQAALLSAQRPMDVLGLTLVQMSATLISGQLLIVRHGLTGYFIADLIGHALRLTVVYCYSRRWLQKNLVAQEWLPKVLGLWCFLLMYSGVCISAGSNPPAKAALLGLAVMIGVSVWTYHSILDRDERHILIRVCQRRTFQNIPAATTD